MRSETGEPVEAQGLRLTHEFFQVFGVTPLLGRAFTAEDEIDGRHRVAILSYGYWQRQYGGSPDAIGKRIEFNEQTFEIVGVMPRGFAYPVASEKPTEIYWPVAFTNDDKVRAGSRNYNWYALVGEQGTADRRRYVHAGAVHGPADRAAPVQHDDARAVRPARPGDRCGWH